MMKSKPFSAGVLIFLWLFELLRLIIFIGHNVLENNQPILIIGMSCALTFALLGMWLGKRHPIPDIALLVMAIILWSLPITPTNDFVLTVILLPLVFASLTAESRMVNSNNHKIEGI
ncbi:MAG: hypothetical protein ACKKL5_02255 [Candidatus Komeilibacteria bacterium]